MYFSGKITNSFVQYLGRQGIDTERLFELTELPTEFLQDSSCWLNAADVEAFLNIIEREFSNKFPDKNLMCAVGHACNDIKAWGVLDGVLKMMQKPTDIYSQPQRFISYFVSPAPPIGNLQREDESISFDLPFSNTEFPLATEYLRAAFEALPLYVGKNMSSAQWRHTKLTVSWSEAQESLIENSEFVVKPEVIHELVASLEEAQRELETQKQIVMAQAHEIEQLKSLSLGTERIKSAFNEDDMMMMRSQVLRLSDYITRSLQLVTLLVRQNRLDRQVQEAMKRLDWDFVSTQYRDVVDDLLKKIETLKLIPATPVKPTRALKRKRTSSELELTATS